MCHSSFGGSVRIATGLAGGLAARGHSVHIITRHEPFCDFRHKEKVSIHTLFPENNDDIHPAALYTDWPDSEINDFTRLAADIISSKKLDILNYHYAAPFARVSARLKNALDGDCPAIIGTLHGSDVSIIGADGRRARRLSRSLALSDVLTTVSLSHARLALDTFNLKVSPVTLPNFTDMKKFSPRAAQKKNIGGKNRKTVIHVSNFRPVKDLVSIANIFHGIRRQTDAELWLVGESCNMSHVRGIFENLRLNDCVRYWGLQRDVAPLLVQADLMLISSFSESFCLAALEAMACGIPVLASRVGGLPEVVRHGATGYLYPPGSINNAVYYATSILKNEKLFSQMSTEAVEQAGKFDTGPRVEAYEALYRRVLSKT